MPQSSRLIISTTDADVPDGAALLGVETVNAVMGIRVARTLPAAHLGYPADTSITSRQ